MYVADMHCDTAAELLRGGSLVNRYNFSEKYPQLQIAAIFSSAKGKSREERLGYSCRLTEKINEECARLGLPLVTDKKSLCECVGRGESLVILSIEGGGGLFADSEELTTLYERGVRVIGPIWDTNELGTSCSDNVDVGLTENGRKFIRKLDQMQIIIDISHASDRSFWEIAELSRKPFIATHSCFREVAEHPRNLTKDMANEISSRGGVVGLSLYPPHLSGKSFADFSDIFRQIDYAIENFGEKFLGFGFDIDGTDGEYPDGIDESGSIHDAVIDKLLSRYGKSITERLCGKNVIECFLRSMS